MPVKDRYEIKYEIDDLHAALLENRLPEVMTRDPNCIGGIYEVRSLYFDDYDNHCYLDNENGNDPREKFRIRIYNGSDVRIRLELKQKIRGKTCKLSCPITREQTQMLMDGENILWDDGMAPLLKKLYIQVETAYLQPKVIVNYERIPFIHPDGNVRITLDRDIVASVDIDSFFEKSFFGRPILPLGKQVLEVKYDELIPDYVFRTLQTNQLKRISCSKFMLCRKYGGYI